MKNLINIKELALFTIALLFFFMSANAQNIPVGMNYQAVARDLSGDILADKNISLKITLYSQQDKQIQYQETHFIITNALGLFSIAIGEGIEELGAFDKVPWSTENIWMELAIDEDGGNNFVTISDSRLLAVPYAFHAATATKLSHERDGTSRFNGGEITDDDNHNPPKFWKLGGNSLDVPGSNVFGALNADDLNMITNNKKRLIIDASGDIHIKHSLDIGAGLEVGSNVFLNTNLKGSTTNNGDFTVANMSATDLTGTLNADGATTLDGGLSMDGTAFTVEDATGNVHSDGTLDVDGATTLNSTAVVTGATALDGGLSMDGTAFTVADGTGNVHSDGTLDVDGATTLNNTLSLRTASGAGHVALFENTNNGNGIEIRVGAGTPHNNNNFITFTNSSGATVGRIEGENGNSDFLNNREYQDALDFIDTDIDFAHTDVVIGLAETIAAGANIFYSLFGNVCGGLGAVACPPEPSVVAIAIGDEILAIANEVFYAANLASINAVKTTFVNTHVALQGVTFASGAGDYAEYLPKINLAEEFFPGEVVGLKNGLISKSTIGADRIMVISHKPAVLGALPEESEEHKYEKVAFLGQIQTWVMGQVAPGDYILSSGFNNGYGRAKHPEKMLPSDYKKILGVAWSGLKDEIGMVNVAVGLNVNDMSDLVSKQNQELKVMKNEMARINGVLGELVPGFNEAANLNPENSYVQHVELKNKQTSQNTSLKVDEHDHDILSQQNVEMVQPDETNIVYYMPERKLYEQGIEMARKIFLESGGKIEDHPFWKRLSSDPDYIEEIIQELEENFDNAIHYLNEVNQDR